MSKIFIFLIILILGFGFLFLLKDMVEKAKIKTELEQETKEEVSLTKISIITLYDNYQFDPRLKTGWGFSCLVRRLRRPKATSSAEGRSPKGEGRFNILFDTGADSETLLSNMEKMEINPKNIDFVFISHLHGDHTGGLPGLLAIKPDLKVYKPESFSAPAEIINGVWTTGPLGTWINKFKERINNHYWLCSPGSC